MSAASAEARALLADERAEEQHGGMSLGAFRVGGIVERLAEDVERLEKAAPATVRYLATPPTSPRAGAAIAALLEQDVAAALSDPRVGAGAEWLVAETKRIRGALEAMKRPHDEFGEDGEDVAYRCPALDGGECTCGASAHNAAIDAALRGDGT